MGLPRRLGMLVMALTLLGVGGAPAHLAFDPEGECAFVGCEISDEIAVIDLTGRRVVERVKASAALG